MNKYTELKNKHQKEVNEFPFIFAFNQEQFNKGMEKLGLKPTDTDKIYSIGHGGYIRRTDSEAMHKMFARHAEEMKKAIAEDTTGDGFIFDMFNYELANHEYIITGDIEDTLNCLDLTIEEINADKRLLHGLKKAIRNQCE